jgi:hypothetical protein
MTEPSAGSRKNISSSLLRIPRQRGLPRTLLCTVDLGTGETRLSCGSPPRRPGSGGQIVVRTRPAPLFCCISGASRASPKDARAVLEFAKQDLLSVGFDFHARTPRPGIRIQRTSASLFSAKEQIMGGQGARADAKRLQRITERTEVKENNQGGKGRMVAAGEESVLHAHCCWSQAYRTRNDKGGACSPFVMRECFWKSFQGYQMNCNPPIKAWSTAWSCKCAS